MNPARIRAAAARGNIFKFDEKVAHPGFSHEGIGIAGRPSDIASGGRPAGMEMIPGEPLCPGYLEDQAL